MVPNFLSLDYLKNGNERQQRAHDVLLSFDVVNQLLPFEPVLTGTIPLGIDIESSDLDIICCYENEAQFSEHIAAVFRHHNAFKLTRSVIRGRATVIARFTLEEFPIEIFGQNQPVVEQEAYLHMVNEYRILESRGPEFRDEIVRLKRTGLKTEPAFAQALNLDGDPYEAMLVN